MNKNRGFYDTDEETQPLVDDGEKARSEKKEAFWDIFENTPRKPHTGSGVDYKNYDFSVKAVKVLSYIVVFLVVLLSAILSKGSLFLMTSQVKPNTTRDFCNKNFDIERKYQVVLPTVERVLWIWLLIFTYFIPQVGTFIRASRKCLFKSWEKNNLMKHFIPLFITESLPAFGSAILVFAILPELDVIKAAMLTNAFCIVPGIVGMISRSRRKKMDMTTFMILDSISIISQLTSFFMWPLLEGKTKLFLIPVSAVCISFGWWENYVDENSEITFIQKLAQERRFFQNRTYFLYIFVSITNCAIFLVTTLLIFWMQEGDFSFLFENFGEAFSSRPLNITEVKRYIEDLTPEGVDDTFSLIDQTIHLDVWTALTIFIINFLSTYICYAFSKFASKVSIQEFSFAFAINLTVPFLVSILVIMTGNYMEDECSFIDIFPEYIFFNLPKVYTLGAFLTQQYAWAWILWLLSQVWITIHIWDPKCENLARTEKLFVKPLYDAFLIDQSVTMNRRRDDSPIEAAKQEKATAPKIYVCATMWHEECEEMLTFLQSIMRLDEDHCAHRIAKHYLHMDPPTFYELECNIFFDDAFIRKSVTDQDPMLNSYVLKMIPIIEVAASEVHGVNIKIRPPKIYSTPYGGRIEWTLPGRTKLIAHLKDKAKIRAKKRWSQVMYMYFLLGYRLLPAIEQKKASSDNTFILALDGDIDFKPEAVHLLMDYMKKNKRLGAACGRIHPVGSGAIAWYQVFEYAVGHWLQKATEHVVGCVLCSPGCFSLFRAEILMQDRVMAKYTTEATQARHRVQYDQGEDRWLCTLILQAGYRVEYSAASDSYTHCPEGFNEFYNQRRRWIPSTMANIFDVLGDYKNIVANNDDISFIYIIYQSILLVGNVIGPGTIFTMLLGATLTVFSMDQWTSFLINFIPILGFILVCALCEDNIQLMAAAILSSVYGLLMMAVFLGVALQIQEDGILAPTSVFFFFMIGEFVVAAAVHPKEFYCLKYAIIYYVTVPSMYMLLMIYSVFNMNNVSWGTRDVTIVPSDTKKPEEKAATPDPKKKKQDLMSYLDNYKTEEGSFELSFAGLFKCFFCTHQSGEYETLKAIKESLVQLNKRMDGVESARASDAKAPTPVVADAAKAPPTKTELMDNSWFYHKELMEGQVEWIEDKEEKFWGSLIEKYLKPIDETDKKATVGKELKDLRDKMVFTFFMLNALFVLVILLLNLKKDVIHLNWPYNAKVNFTYIKEENEVAVSKAYLQLEPIGFVFLLSFGVLLVVQSFGMFVHRFETFSQILSNTKIEWNIFKSKDEDAQDVKSLSKDNAVRIAKKLQQLHSINKTKDELENDRLPASQRKSVFMPGHYREKKRKINDLVESYKARMKLYEDEDFEGPVDRKTIASIKVRQSQVLRKSQAQLLQPKLDAAEAVENIPLYGVLETNFGETTT